MCQPFVAVCRHTTTTHDSALGPHNHLEITRSLNFQNLPGDLRTTRVCRTTTDGRQQRTRTTTDNTDTTVPYSTPRRTTHRPRAQGKLPNRRHSSCGPDDDRDSTRLAVHPTWRSHAVRGDSIRAHGTRAGCARLSLDGIWTDIPLPRQHDSCVTTQQEVRDNTSRNQECCATSSVTLMRWLCQRICTGPAQAEACRCTWRMAAPSAPNPSTKDWVCVAYHPEGPTSGPLLITAEAPWCGPNRPHHSHLMPLLSTYPGSCFPIVIRTGVSVNVGCC